MNQAVVAGAVVAAAVGLGTVLLTTVLIWAGPAQVIFIGSIMNGLFITNSFDGSMGIRVGTCMTRIVCSNTMAAAERESRRTHSIRHTKNFRIALHETKAALRRRLSFGLPAFHEAVPA